MSLYSKSTFSLGGGTAPSNWTFSLLHFNWYSNVDGIASKPLTFLGEAKVTCDKCWLMTPISSEYKTHLYNWYFKGNLWFRVAYFDLQHQDIEVKEMWFIYKAFPKLTMFMLPDWINLKKFVESLYFPPKLFNKLMKDMQSFSKKIVYDMILYTISGD